MKQYKTLDMNDGRGGEHIQTHARPLWIISTFLISYLLNLASSTANVLWLPDPLALTLIYWTIHHPRHVGMTIAFICGLLMDVQNGSVLGQQALAYVILSYSAYSLHRRLPWFGLAGQALHILPLLLVSQLVVLMIRLWFDGLWPGFPWFLQSFTGALLWPAASLILSLPERRSLGRESVSGGVGKVALDFKQVDADLVPFRRRLLFVFFLVIVLFCVLIGRFAWLQIINKNAYTERAEKNRTVTVVSQAARGLIYDRNGELLAKNTLAYSLEITPDKVSDLEKTIDALSEIIPITTADRRRFVRLREDLNRYDSIPIRQELTDEEVAVFTGQQWRFPGVEINQREYRVYPEGSVGSHILGYIGSLSQSDKKRLTSEGLIDDYEGERVIGKVGIERSYESLLHGTPGHETLEITAGGHAVRSLAFEPPKAGKNLHLTIDMNLQRVAENAMKGKVGAVIAIQPKTGEILSFVSMPTYDPNLFPGGIDPKSWSQLNTAETKPLLNRAMRGLYPIGSTYKPFVALAGLETGATTADFVLDDTGVFTLGKHRFRDMSGVPKGRLDLRKSIAVSSDVYYYWLATRLGVDTIHDFMVPWGFGQKTGIDLVGEQTGVLPSREWKEARVKQPWMVGDTPSIGIGQGYNAFTLLQLAHATSTLANRGIVMTPHLVKRITDPSTNKAEDVPVEPAAVIPLKSRNVETVIAGMTDVSTKGTARFVFKGVPYTVACKTGTAQVVTIAQDDKYDAKKLAKKHHDHALFIAFAPARNPRIALAVLVENGGFGAQAAAPVARQLIDYWLTGANSLELPPPKGVPLITQRRNR